MSALSASSVNEQFSQYRNQAANIFLLGQQDYEIPLYMLHYSSDFRLEYKLDHAKYLRREARVQKY